MKVVVFGAGMQGTLYGVRLAAVGHAVTLIARGQRAAELRSCGAIIENAVTTARHEMRLPVLEELDTNLRADLCLVTVRRDQLDDALPLLRKASGMALMLFMVNHACGSQLIFDALGRERAVLGFPGAAGSIEDGIDRYIEIPEQPTAIEARFSEVAETFIGAGFRVSRVRDMDSWLRRHAVFVTAVSGALYKVGCDAHRLSSDDAHIRAFILAIREGWAAMDRHDIGSAPIALRAIFQWVPLPLAVWYWKRLLASARGEYYFARHARHAANEMVALATDVRALTQGEPTPQLEYLYAAIYVAAAAVHP